MATATITITDSNEYGDVNVQCTFNPHPHPDDIASPAQSLAVVAMQAITDECNRGSDDDNGT